LAVANGGALLIVELWELWELFANRGRGSD
jgi:hypothetical protein